MPLENATYIADLVTSNPASSDQVAAGDDQIRMIKGALKATFPAFTSAALTSSNAQLDAAAAATINGVSVLSDSGVAFKTNTTDKITNPAAGEIDLTLAGTLAAKFVNTSSIVSVTLKGSLATDGGIAATGPITGPGSVPIGGMIMWLTDTLPSGAGVWCWANGGTLSRTGNGAALYALTGTTYGAGDGSSTFNVINMCETTPVGKSTMGAAASRGLLTGITSSLITTLGSLFGGEKQSLAAGNMPQQTVNVSGNITVKNPNFPLQHEPTSHFTPPGGGTSSVPITNADVVEFSGINTMTGTIGNATPTPVEIVQPSTAVNFIIRIA